MKERKMRSETENQTYSGQRLAEAGVARSYVPDQSASFSFILSWLSFKRQLLLRHAKQNTNKAIRLTTKYQKGYEINPKIPAKLYNLQQNTNNAIKLTEIN